MGVTIHFQGQLSSVLNTDKVIATAINFAEKYCLDFYLLYEKEPFVQKGKGQRADPYELPKGIIINPGENCEPFILDFDEKYAVQNFCKTQYADLSVHVLVVDLLREIEPFFHELSVLDEANYWETRDISILEKRIGNCFEAIKEAKQDNDQLVGPMKLENGRIVDLTLAK